jgi:hypothetical protein
VPLARNNETSLIRIENVPNFVNASGIFEVERYIKYRIGEDIASDLAVRKYSEDRKNFIIIFVGKS